MMDDKKSASQNLSVQLTLLVVHLQGLGRGAATKSRVDFAFSPRLFESLSVHIKKQRRTTTRDAEVS